MEEKGMKDNVARFFLMLGLLGVILALLIGMIQFNHLTERVETLELEVHLLNDSLGTLKVMPSVEIKEHQPGHGGGIHRLN